MKKTLRSLVLVAGMLSATALCSSAFADDMTPPPAGHQHGEQGKGCREGKQRGHQFFARLAKKLGLSDQQKAQAKTMFQANRDQVKPLMASLRTERHQLRQLIQSGEADEAAIRAQSAKVAGVQADLAVQRAKMAKQFIALLTPDQKTKLKALQAQREEKFRKHGEEGTGKHHDHHQDGDWD